ncbi:carbohydrate ABC transporter permease [Clostridium thermarum]|uniref:carbohydrate ABC transporter permease n=1 Tax=Clostridium thermarum TaxID=1716543 RepID=UPI0013D06954|nr:carbohydrate ABC transporter permease [Clostridium thermarum]
MARKLTPKEKIHRALKYAVLVFMLFIFIIPILVVFFAAFKTREEFATTGVLTMPSSFLNFDNFAEYIKKANLLRGFKNTFIIMVFSLFGSVMTGSMSAFIFSRFKSMVSNFANNLFLLAAIIPGITTTVATFQIVSKLGMFNTRLAPIVLYFGTDVMSIYIFLQFLENISVSLDESAIIDGANYFQIFFKIIMPLLKPAVITVVVIKGIGIYNDFYTPFLYTPKQELLTISTTLYNFKGPFGSRWDIICAGIVIIIIPTLITFLLLQSRIYNGLAAGSVKE